MGSEPTHHPSDALFRQLAELAPDSIVVLVRGRFAYANPAAVRSLGYDSLEEFLAITPRDFLSAEDLGAMMERVERVRRGERLAPREYTGLKRDGGTMVMEISSTVIDFEGQEAILAFGRDVTERRTMQTRLVQQDRLAAVGTLAAGVAHEINNPLSYVLLNLQRLERLLPEHELGPGHDTLLASVGEAIEGALRVNRIVRDLLAFSRQVDADEAAIDLVGVCESTRKLVECSVARGMQVVTSYADGPIVRGNETRLGQVMLNLLLNAAQALEGRVDGEIRIAVRTEDERAVVEVSDNGPGIPEPHLPLIFTPFFTTKEVGRGTGLGLSISHGIVTALGGSIQAKNHGGGGALLRVELPIATPNARVEPRAQDRRLPSRRARVMVVDDERALAQAVGALLRAEHDVEIHVEPTGALRMLEEAQETFDMVLCDVLMPRLSGIELYVRIRASRPEYGDRFVFMTGGALDDGARTLIVESAAPLVQKPFDIEQILGLIRERVNQSRTPFSSRTGAPRV